MERIVIIQDAEPDKEIRVAVDKGGYKNAVRRRINEPLSSSFYLAQITVRWSKKERLDVSSKKAEGKKHTAARIHA